MDRLMAARIYINKTNNGAERIKKDTGAEIEIRASTLSTVNLEHDSRLTLMVDGVSTIVDSPLSTLGISLLQPADLTQGESCICAPRAGRALVGPDYPVCNGCQAKRWCNTCGGCRRCQEI